MTPTPTHTKTEMSFRQWMAKIGHIDYANDNKMEKAIERLLTYKN